MNTISSSVAKQFQKVSQISCDNTRKPCSKVLRADSVKFVLSYNPILSSTYSLISNYLPILIEDLDLKDFFSRKSITTVYRRQKSLKEMLAPSSYLKIINGEVNIIISCNSCDIWKHYLVAEIKFACKVTDKTYFIKIYFFAIVM